MVDWKDIDGRERTAEDGLGDAGAKVAEEGGVTGISGSGAAETQDDQGSGSGDIGALAAGTGSPRLANDIGQGEGTGLAITGSADVVLRGDATISAGDIIPFNLSVYATPLVPRTWANPREHLTKLADGLNLALMGRVNCAGVVTLQVDQTTTVITDPRIGVFSYIALMPETDNARQAIGDVFVAQRLNGTATLVHSSNNIPDRRFTYVVLGG